MSNIIVIKRDGSNEDFDVEKISNSIMEAAMQVGGEDMELADELADMVLDILESNEIDCIESSELQKIVEKTLIEEGHAATSKEYILKAADRNRMREMDSALMKSFEEITFKSEAESEVKRENANIDSSTAMGTMLKYGSEGAKNFNLLYMMSSDIADEHKNGDIHIHDLDFLALTMTCCQIPIDKLFKNGFNTGHGFLREPGNIRTASALAAIAIQSNQNDQHGGQSIPLFDYYLAPYVALTYAKTIAHVAKQKLDLSKERYKEIKNMLVDYQQKHTLIMNEECETEMFNILSKYFEDNNIKVSAKRLKKVFADAYEDTYDETFQAMEAFIHNLNTMHCLPASEKIWVLDVETNKIMSITMEELNNTFKPNKYKAISLNKQSGKAEFKFITASKKMDNNRDIVKITDNQGRTVRITDNHRVMTIDRDALTITEQVASDVECTVSPRGIKMPVSKYDLCVSDYGKPRKDNPFQLDHVIVNEKFAEFIGYYMADGCMLGETSTCCISACGKISFEYMENLLEEVFGCKFKTSYTYFEHSTQGTTEKDIRIQLGMPLTKMLKDKFGRVGKEKKIPMELMCAPDDVKKAFLKAYFALDGRRDSKYSELSTVNKELQAQVALMISSLGFSSHYNTRKCTDGFETHKNRMDMHFLSLGARDSYRLGIKDSCDTAFEIPKYDLSFIYDKYAGYCDSVAKGNRDSKNIRYTELEELIDTFDVKDAEKFRNIFVNEIKNKELYNSGEEYVYDISVEDNESFLTYECIFVHNSRAGAQVPFSSINYGTDTSTEGRMIVETILKTTWDGLGNGETPIFPIQIYKLKKGVTFGEGAPNNDLFKLACKVSAKRLYPNFVNLDAPYNAELYIEGKPETEMATMGCRTRVGKNMYDTDKSVIPGRGNLSFTSINLPRLGILANGDVDKFFKLLDKKLELVHRQLLERFEIQCKKKPINFPFLMGQGCWLGSDKLGPNDNIREILKHGSLTVGFIGLAETLTALIGKHHGESEEAQKLGLKIIQHMRDYTDAWSKEECMNYTVIGTPAEGLSGRFLRLDRERFGTIKGVTDKDYYTNSSHIPVSFEISAFKKVELEAPYHSIQNGGHILYIEMGGDPTQNLKAFEKLIYYMHEKNAGYMAINHPVDRDSVCGYVGIIGDVCPRCGRKEGEAMSIEMWQKLKGYAGAGNADTLGASGNPDEEADRISNNIDDIKLIRKRY